MAITTGTRPVMLEAASRPTISVVTRSDRPEDDVGCGPSEFPEDAMTETNFAAASAYGALSRQGFLFWALLRRGANTPRRYS
jgi:hypothetical protein